MLSICSHFACYSCVLQVCIAFAFAVSTAMEKTKLAKAIADLFVALSEFLGLLRSWLGFVLTADRLR